MCKPSLILVVDDDPTNRLLFARTLEKAGYEVLSAEDGFKGVEMANEHRPDLVLLDMMMPERNGLEVCSVLKSQDQTAAIPVIFVTAVSEPAQILKAFSVGGCDYLTKPFRPAELLARVSVHVRLRRAEEELRHKHEQMEDLTRQLAESNIELTNRSRLDPLTRLVDRRAWEEVAVQEHERFERGGSHYSIVMIDADFFKAFNDTRGHQAGDDCLRRVAESITSACRGVDTVGRYGGEEFVILAPQTRAEAAVKLAERVRKAIWALGIPHPGSAVANRVTVSLGVAASKPGSWEEVLKRADDALYVAKKAGRNMVHSAAGAAVRTGPPAAAECAPDPEDQPQNAQASAVSVLVVDDEPANRAICKVCLERAGCRVREVGDGREALAAVEEDAPDVIVMDMMMPNMDGLDCTRALKADPDTRDIPIIMFSASTKSEDILAGLKAGADEYLAKPIRTRELVLRVRSLARLHRERDDLLASYQVRGERVRILSCLVEYCRAISAGNRLDQVLEHTINVVAEVTRCRRISIMLPEGQGERLGISRSIGIDQDLAAAVRVPVGQPIAGQVFASGRPVVNNTHLPSEAASEVYDSHFFASAPLISTPLAAPGEVVGVLNVTERAGGQPFEPYELEYIELIGQIAATAIRNVSARVARDEAGDAIMVALAQLAEHRDIGTGLHLDRVTRYCCILAQELRAEDQFADRIDEDFIHDLVRAVPLHDIGKVAIPDEILLHPGKLTDKQMAVVRTHAAIGAQTIRALIERAGAISFLEMAADIAHYHHERYDCCGYPLGLKGDAIPLAARITALADVYDALTTRRVYKEAVSHDEAVAVIKEESGRQFDPAVVDAFRKRAQDFARVAEEMADERPAEDAARCPKALPAGLAH